METKKVVFKTDEETRVTDLQQKSREWYDENKDKIEIVSSAYGVQKNKKNPRQYDKTLTVTYTEKKSAKSKKAESKNNDGT